MFTALLTTALSLGAAAAQPGDPPAQKELFAKERWYQAQEGKEETFTGRLEENKRAGGAIGFGRVLPFRLVMRTEGKEDVRTVYVGSNTGILKPYVGRTVRLTGKAVNLEVEGERHREIWPARLEVVTPQPR